MRVKATARIGGFFGHRQPMREEPKPDITQVDESSDSLQSSSKSSELPSTLNELVNRPLANIAEELVRLREENAHLGQDVKRLEGQVGSLLPVRFF